MKKPMEIELYPPVKKLFEKNGYEVHSEINYCDIVARKNEELIIIELKTTLSINLILQAIKRQRLTEYVFIAVPKLKIMATKKWKDYQLLIKRLGLGLIIVHLKDGYAEITIEPALYDMMQSLKRNKKKRNKLVIEFNGRSDDYNVGGSTRRKIMTAYKEQSLYIAACIDLMGPLSPKKLRSYGAHPKKTNSILQKNFNRWFYRVRTGLYDLSDEGKKALNKYELMVKRQKIEIENKINNL